MQPVVSVCIFFALFSNRLREILMNPEISQLSGRMYNKMDKGE